MVYRYAFTVSVYICITSTYMNFDLNIILLIHDLGFSNSYSVPNGLYNTFIPCIEGYLIYLFCSLYCFNSVRTGLPACTCNTFILCVPG